MTTTQRRLQRLEQPLGLENGKPVAGKLFIISPAGWPFALDGATCEAILRECGFVPDGPAISSVNFCQVPRLVRHTSTAFYTSSA